MVELAKTRGGHDNITGVAIQVIDVVDAVPQQMEGESTQPVDLSANPFASDEPTQTAFMSPPGLPKIGTPPPMPHPLKVTQPMRIVSDESFGDTIPPPGTPPVSAGAEGEEVAEAKPAAEPKLPDGAEAHADAAAKDAEGATPDSEGTPDGAPLLDDDAPTEIATADTGRIALPKGDEGA
jgi:hypothetical protein